MESFQTTQAREDETRGVGGRKEDGEEKSEEEKLKENIGCDR